MIERNVIYSVTLFIEETRELAIINECSVIHLNINKKIYMIISVICLKAKTSPKMKKKTSKTTNTSFYTF